MNLLIINQPLNNRGDESAHKGFVRTIIREIPDAQITVLFINSNNDSIKQFEVKSPNILYVNLKSFIKGYNKIGIYGLKKHATFLWQIHPTIRKFLKFYKKADIVICAPGGICMGGFQNWNHLFMLHLAKFCKRKLFYYGRSFGPFPTETVDNRKFRELSLEILHYFSFLSIRDKKTEILADKLHLHYVSTIDSAFLDSPAVEVPESIYKQIGKTQYIVFVPNLLIWHYAYKNRIDEENVIYFFKELINRVFNQYPDHKIVMLPQTFNYGTYEGDDIHICKKISNAVNDDRIIIVPDYYSSDIQQSIISKSNLLIGARYHSIVFAINNNVPFIALSYEHKIAGLLTTLKKEDCMIDITKALETSQSMQTTISIVEQKLTTIKSDRQARDIAKKIAYECFKKFKNSILEIYK